MIIENLVAKAAAKKFSIIAQEGLQKLNLINTN